MGIEIFLSALGTGTIIAALVGQIYAAKSRIAIELIANSRTKWIQEVRGKTADMLSCYYQYTSDYRNWQRSNFTSNELKEKKEQSCKKFQDSLDFLSLYFVDDANDKQINFSQLNDYDSEIYINLFIQKSNKDKHQYIVPLLEDLKKQVNGRDEDIKMMTKILAIYLKIEWDRVKNTKIFRKEHKKNGFNSMIKRDKL